jgi:TRAP-type uncharacterized transport system substrate-binding protein
MGSRGIPAQARIGLLNQGSTTPEIYLFGSNAPSVIPEVARGEVQLAIVNPSTILALAHRGTGPFKEPLPVRTLTVLPSHDQFLFALAEHTGLTSLKDIRDRRYPLKVSVRAQPDHGGHVVINETLGAYGFSIDDIVSWGGAIRRHPNIPTNEPKAVERGELDAIFDEAVANWAPAALEIGMHIVSLDEPVLQKLEATGFRRARVSRDQYRQFPREVDVMTLDFSGWAVFTSAAASDDLVTMICAALEARRDRIPWEGEGPLPLDRMCIDAEEAPLPAPLHPAAEEFWRARGYLS